MMQAHVLASSSFTLPVAHQPSVAARAAHWAFSIPQAAEASLSKNASTKQSVLGRTLTAIIKKIGDFDHYKQVSIGKLKLSVPSPGAFFFLVIPLTVIPRVYQALNREDTRFRLTELGDILRRDMLTLFSLLYAFGPFQSWMTRRAGNKQGITLQDPLSGKIYQSSDTSRLYTLNQQGDVERILKPLEGATHGLVTEQALVREYTKEGKSRLQWIEKKIAAIGEHPDLMAAKQELTNLVDIVLPNFSKQTLPDKDKALVSSLNRFESNVSHWVDEAPKLRNVLAHAADATRTPVSVVSFLLVCGLIGVAPDVFNKLWNQRRFARLKQEHMQIQGETLLARLQPSKSRLQPFLG